MKNWRAVVVTSVIAAVFLVAALGWIFTDWYIFDGGIHPRFRE